MPPWPRGRRSKGSGGNGERKGRNRYWNASGTEESERPKPPPGLRGKQIGLFYRDLQKNKPKTERKFTIGLTIPTGVIKQVCSRLQSIVQIAQNHKIDLSHIPQMIRVKLEIENESEEIVIPSTSHSHNNVVKQENINTESHYDKSHCVKQSKKPWNEDLNDIHKFLQDKRQHRKPESFVPYKNSEDFISLNKPETSSNYSKNNNFSSLNKKVSSENLKSLNKEISIQDNSYSKCISNICDSNISLNKEASQRDVLMNREILNKDVKEEFISPDSIKREKLGQEPCTSSASDFIPINQDDILEYGTGDRLLSLRGGGDFKYGYNDIITGTFDEKLDDCLMKGISISNSSSDVREQNEHLYQNYVQMLEKDKYNKMIKFRETLPTYKKSSDILEVLNNSSVVVISGETGCGKSTQVPQIILDDAIINKRGANTKIIVTQPRRIAASSLAERVAAERAEKLGNSVGYAVRLERVEARARGSISYFTTGILLSDLEVNQGLTNVSHVILDEVHERDTHVDLAMVLLKKILKKRKDLKVILMSATLDADSLSAYFDNCPVLHIEGLAYPVTDVYLEEILKLTNFNYDDDAKKLCNDRKTMEKSVKYRAEISPWLESIKHSLNRNVYKQLQDMRTDDICIELIISLIKYICNGEPGAILVFVPGIGEITKLLTELQQARFSSSKYEIYPLHSKLPSLEQKKIFERPPEGVRKIIIATNIAETSITIDDIVYVIDCGKIKIKGLIVKDNLATLKSEWVSQANLRQRRGRAGRCQPGICYHLMTTFRASQLEERILPELQRTDLLEEVLMVKQLRLGKAEEALNLVPDPPADATVSWAVKHLRQLGALDESETLTPLGWHLARLPVHPAAGKLLLLGALFGCLDRAASVAAVWGFKDPFMLVIGKENECRDAKRELALGEPSDHIAISEAIITWERSSSQARNFAYNFYLSNNTLQLLSEMKRQFGNNLKNMGFLASGDIKSRWENRNAQNLSLFKAIVAASLYPNVGNVRWHGMKHNNPRKPPRILARTAEDGRVEIHPSSILAATYNRPQPVCATPGANWLVYWLKQKSTKLFLFEITLVYTLPLLFFGELIVTHDDDHPDDCFIGISTSYKVKCNKQTAGILFELRGLLDHVLANKVMASSDHAMQHNEFEDQVLNAVIELITAEDEQADYGNDSGEESDRDEYKSYQRNSRR